MSDVLEIIDAGIFDYYLARAPEPPSWYEPEMPDKELRYFCWKYYHTLAMIEIRTGDHAIDSHAFSEAVSVEAAGGCEHREGSN